MKQDILQIAKDLEKGDITEDRARSLLLGLFSVSKRYLVKFVDSFWFEHETTVESDCQFDAIEQVQKQFKGASHFSVSEL